MLLELSIDDFAIIDHLRIPFEPGLNVLTGETGAGKSIIIDALGAVLGERVGADVVRTGSRVARVEATFDVSAIADRPDFAATLNDLGVEPDDGIVILSRELSAGGRSSARINGRSATAGMLARLGALLVDIHGQSDHLSLLRPAAHLDLLDRFAGLTQQRDRFGELVREWSRVRQRIDDIVTGARERAQRVDLLEFQVREIEAAQLRPGEEEELLAERTVLANAEQLATEAAAIYDLLAGSDDEGFAGATVTGALPALRAAARQLAQAGSLDQALAGLGSRVEELVYLLEDVTGEVRNYRDTIEADPARLEAVEERLDLIKRLKRKYGATVEEVIAYGEEAARELATLTGDEVDLDALREEEERLRTELGRVATELSRARRAAADRLSRMTEEAIAELNMGRAQFAVSFRHEPREGGLLLDTEGGPIEVAFDETGADRVEFLLAPNAGEALKPLARIASGGEMARLMLALKSILSAADETPTLVFDEVDVGVGGRSGQVVGEKLWSLTDRHQVLVITHLPQIAAFASTHFRITKGEEDGRTVSRVRQIRGEDRIDELAAMLDGEPVTEASRANAREMLRRVEAWMQAAREPELTAVSRT
ncbi:MAG TPA: DNA repair protein RecN [Thermomicrobiales bacterium]